MRGWSGLRCAALVICVCSSASLAAADDDDSAACDKSQYTLFNPTPTKCMREFEPDHPDQTSNPFTIDAGHFEPETTLFGYFHSAPDADRTIRDGFELLSTDFRLGVTNNFEVGLDVSPVDIIGWHYAGPTQDKWKWGPDSLGLETKYNIYGNDTFGKPGSTSLAILTDLDVPTVRNGIGEENVEGSIALPFAIKLSEKSDLELMTRYDIIHNDEGSGYHVEFFNSGSYSYDWTEKFSTYFEVATRFNADDPPGPMVNIGVGAAYQPNENTQIDCGVNIGLTEATDPVNPFFGVVRRF